MEKRSVLKKTGLLVLGLQLALSSCLAGHGAMRVDAGSSIVDHADPAMKGSLANVLSQIGSATCAVVKLPGNSVYVLGQDLTVPSNVDLKFLPGAVLSVSEGAALSINGGIEAGLRQIFSGEGIVGGAPKIVEVYPQWFGTKGDGDTDDTQTLQNAIDFACRTGIKAVNLNRGTYVVTKTIDCTNLRQPGTLSRDGLRIYGTSGFVGANTVIVGETGDGHAILEISGIQSGEFDNFRLVSGKKNPSTVGLFMGCPKKLPQCQNNVIHIGIGMHDDMNANGGLGTIALWNFAAEENTYQSVYFVANRPVVLSAFNNSPAAAFAFNYEHSYVELLQVHSLGVTAFSGECFVQSLGGAPVFTTQCANTLVCENTYVCGRGNGSAVFEVYGSLVNLNYKGVVEGRATFLQNNGSIINGDISATYGGVVDQKAPLIRMGDKSRIINTTLKFALEAARDRNLFAQNGSARSKAKAKGGDIDKAIKEGKVAGEVAPVVGLKQEAITKAALVNTEIFTSGMKDEYLKVPNVLRKGSRNSRIIAPAKIIEL
ncbi:MAG: glycosyl hydrolase family 28-related protein [Verrucomicrobiota bacterium]